MIYSDRLRVIAKNHKLTNVKELEYLRNRLPKCFDVRKIAMQHLKQPELKFWQEYLNSLDNSMRPINPTVSAGYAGSPEITDELLALYLSGKKNAGSSILEDFLSCGDPVPKVGDYWIFLDSKANPRIILLTEKVVLHKFYDVPKEIAIAEGEGDLSIEYWREVHADLYQPQLENWGVKNLDEATVITEFFSIVYR